MKEAVLALELERRYSKDRILEMYLNQIYFGHGAYGVEAAARTYFGKSVSELNVREAALHRRAAPRALRVLAVRARRGGQAPPRAGAAADGGLRRAQGGRRQAAGPLGSRADPARAAPHHRPVLPRVRAADARGEVRRRHGLQGRAERLHHAQPAHAARRRAGAARGAQGAGGPHAERAAPASIPKAPSSRSSRPPATCGRMVGGYDFFRSEFNRAVQARRQPGSAFKPFVYIAALESGFTAATPRRRRAGVVRRRSRRPGLEAGELRSQVPRPHDAAAGDRGVGQRRDREAAGAHRASTAPCRWRGASGVTSPLDVNLSLALGTSDLTLLEMTSAYGALANQGVWMPPTTIRYVTDAQGKLLEEHLAAGTRGASRRRRRTSSPTCCAESSSAAPGRRPRRWAGRSPRRPARPTTTRTRGSSASRRSSPRASGSATTGRAASGRTRPARASRCRSG